MHDMRDRAAPSRSTAGDDAHATPGKHTRVNAIPHEPGAPASSAHPVQRKATADRGDGHAAQHGDGGAAGPHGASIHSLFGRNHGEPGARGDAALDAADEHDAEADDGDGDTPASVALKAGRPPVSAISSSLCPESCDQRSREFLMYWLASDGRWVSPGARNTSGA